MRFRLGQKRSPITVAILTAIGCSLPLTAAVLPEDRADFLYHRYDGGGLVVNGPSIQARKQLGDDFSFSAKYYVDSISAATIDVMSSASPFPFTDERREQDYSLEYLRNETTISLSTAISDESDYKAKSFGFSISQDFFGDMTTISLGVSRAADKVWKNNYSTVNDVYQIISQTFIGDIDRNQFRLGLSQILSKNLIVSFSHETITDEGFPAEDQNSPLSNPYRLAYYVEYDEQLDIFPCPINDPCPANERYPVTRTSNAFAFRAMYYLPFKAAIKGEYRLFSDTWGVEADMVEITLSQTIKQGFIFDIHYRFYSQTKASFYSDRWAEAQTFMARDKELSTFESTTIGGRISYNILENGWKFIDRGSLNFSYDRIVFNYKDFYDRSPKGESTLMDWSNDAPLYNFTAEVTQFYVSIWY